MAYLGNQVAPLVQALEGKELKLDSDGDSSIQASTDDTVIFKTNGSNRWTLNSSGNLFPASTSQGIVLGATSDTAANRLEDYEEGTWSPSHATGSGTGSFADSSYTKIGNLVHVVVSFTFSSGGGTLGIGNLPFTASLTGVGISREDAVNGYSAHARVTKSTTLMELYGTQTTGNPSGYQTTSGIHRVSLTYFTDS